MSSSFRPAAGRHTARGLWHHRDDRRGRHFAGKQTQEETGGGSDPPTKRSAGFSSPEQVRSRLTWPVPAAVIAPAAAALLASRLPDTLERTGNTPESSRSSTTRTAAQLRPAPAAARMAAASLPRQPKGCSYRGRRHTEDSRGTRTASPSLATPRMAPHRRTHPDRSSTDRRTGGHRTHGRQTHGHRGPTPRPARRSRLPLRRPQGGYRSRACAWSCPLSWRHYLSGGTVSPPAPAPLVPRRLRGLDLSAPSPRPPPYRAQAPARSSIRAKRHPPADSRTVRRTWMTGRSRAVNLARLTSFRATLLRVPSAPRYSPLALPVGVAGTEPGRIGSFTRQSAGAVGQNCHLRVESARRCNRRTVLLARGALLVAGGGFEPGLWSATRWSRENPCGYPHVPLSLDGFPLDSRSAGSGSQTGAGSGCEAA
jgi:hypothetical protein